MEGNRGEVRIGSRGSDLALWQARWVKDRLSERFPALGITIEIIRTTGDRILDSPLSRIGDKGLFTKEIEHALAVGQIDVAVHSLKDLPTTIPDGLTLAAVTEREDVRDAFVPHPRNPRRSLWEQPPGARIATGSLRRRSQILHRRPDMKIVDIRGNLHSRMKKLEESDWEGMLLACAGLKRLGWESAMGETLRVQDILPAVGQGALGIEIRADDTWTGELVSVLSHRGTTLATIAERTFLSCLEGGCQIPIGAFGALESDMGGEILRLEGVVASLDGSRLIRHSMSGPPGSGEELGASLANELLRQGAGNILKEIRLAAP